MMPTSQTMATYRVLLGDALEQLRTLPDGSVQCAVTSPPYMGLRDYGVPPTIWGGDSVCEHWWAARLVRTESTPSIRWQHLEGGAGHNRHAAAGIDPDDRREFGAVATGFCVRCGAWKGCLGFEPTPDLYVQHLVTIFREVRRVLRNDGTLWLNLGDSYAHKQLLGIPWRVAFALQEDGWFLRSDIVWSKPSPMPESVTDRPTRSHEYVFLLSQSLRYYYDAEAIREPALGTNAHDLTGPGYAAPGQTAQRGNRRSDKQRGHSRRHEGFNDRWDLMTKSEQQSMGRNKRDVWVVATRGYEGAHFATFPEALVEPMILAGCPAGGTVLDPFAGSGTTLAVANRLGRHAIGIELNPAYARLIHDRCRQSGFVFAEGEGR